MGTITKRQRLNGGIAYLARIRLKRDGKVIYQETKTLETHRRATDWIRDREAELARPGELARLARPAATLADAIERYTEDSRSKIGRTKEQVLNAILSHPIAGKQCETIKSGDLVEFAKSLSDSRQPQTVGNYMSHLQSVFAVAKPAWGYPLDLAEFKSANVVTRRLGITSKSGQRDRRPTLDELDRLLRYFETRSDKSPDASPMAKIVVFALFSTRRQEEITRIRWADLDEQHSRVLVRDMKNPGEKIGNDVWCDLPAPALAIIQATPQREVEIFPYNCRSISAAFTRAAQFLAIDDLHFHDLRHDGISRLFEIGLNIPHVAAVSGHRTWTSLKRYTHLRTTGDKYEGWPWLERVTQPQPPHKPQRAPSAAETSR